MIMKHNPAKSLLCILLVLTLCTGCSLGSYQTNPGLPNNDPTNGSTGGTDATTGPNEPGTEQTPYTVRLLYNNEPFSVHDAQISVVWHGQSSDVVVPLEANGTANAGALDGDFDIYLIGLPEQYSYNPGIYHATADKRHVDIIICDIRQPIDGDGGINANPPSYGLYTNGGCYVVKYQGTYRVTCTEPGQIFYFEYQPTASGIYSVESWCNIYEDEINPLVDIYKGTAGAKYFSETRDGGGTSLSGGFTKNFRYEIDIADRQVGNTYTFGVYAYSKTGEYPVTFDFAITYEGEAPDRKTIEVRAENIHGVDKAKNSNAPYRYADYLKKNASDEKVFNGAFYRLDEDGYYRVYDKERYADNDGWGPRLLCDITAVNPSYTLTSLYDANKVQGSANNYLRMEDWNEEEQGNSLYDYTRFIRTDYYSKCNSDGRCYVTQELKEFLQLYAIRHNLWTDGAALLEGSGTPEENGYSANQDDMWLFACGFYDDRS